MAGFRYSQPLWFLGVFLLCQALLPVLLAAHERAPLRSLLGLAAAAVVVEVMSAVSGIEAIGLLNLGFVWLALQQLGFLLADGHLDALHRRTRVLTALTAVALLAGLVAAGVYSPDLVENLNPPTVALLLVGVAQTSLLSLGRHRLAGLSQRRAAAAFTGFVTARAMTIYLWHMPVLLAAAGVTALVAMGTGIVLPEPSSGGWWLTRPLWLGLAAGLTAGVAWLLTAGERGRMPVATASVRRASQAVLAGLAGVVLQLAAGTTVLTAAAATGLLLFALARIRAGAGNKKPGPRSG
ncbi:acyltransferase family protein [Citricoccus nitrophenolicus]|uniref:Acyltransferase family protein n=1 Tax=Citricoccus nitrophenolicus TaxID=863575 RepID=A0ABV0IH08_9MICC